MDESGIGLAFSSLGEGLLPKKFVARPLYPLRDALRDHRRILQALVQFLHRYGYWPATAELSAMLHADHGGVVWCLKNLATQGLCVRNHRPTARGYFELTPAGWTALGLKPIEPWIRRPKRLLSRIAHAVTLDLADLAAAQRELDARHGTPLARNGALLHYAAPRAILPDELPSQRPKPKESAPAPVTEPPTRGKPPPWLLVDEEIELVDGVRD